MLVRKPVGNESSQPGYQLFSACVINGRTVELPEDEILRKISEGKDPVWLRVVVHDREAAIGLLRDRLGFHDLAVEDALSPEERPSLHDYGDHIFLAAAKVIREGPGERYLEIGFFLRRTALITVTMERVPMLEEWFAKWATAPHHFSNSPAYLLHALLDALVDEYFLAVDDLEDEVDALAERIYGGDTHQVRGILVGKRRFLDLRRHITPLRDILNGLLRRDMDLIPREAKMYFQDVYDHTLRIAETADLNRDTLTSILDVHLSTVSNNLNEVVKKMTVISTILMTGALVAGIYGMNFKHMPELNWVFGYPFAILLMVVAGLMIFGLFRWKGWV